MHRSSVIVTIALTVTLAASGAEAKLDLYVDKSTQQISIVQNGSLLYVWPVSTGRDQFSTPSGIYAPERLERSWFSKAYYNAPMPHAIFFHNGYAIHGSYDIARLGGPASHGCVRLHPQDAAMLFAMVEQEGPGNTTIVIGDDGPPLPRAPRYREMDDRFRSANLGDGGIARGAYPPSPRMAPYMDDRFRSANPGDGGIARGAYPPGPRMAPYMDDRFRSANPGDGGIARGAYPPSPRIGPYYDTDHRVEAAGRRRGDNGPLAMGGAYPVKPPPAPRRDAEASVEPAIGPRGNIRPPERGAYPGKPPPVPRRDAEASVEPAIGLRGSIRPPERGGYPVKPPAPRRDAEASVEPAIGLRGSIRPPETNKPKTNREPDTPANRHANPGETVKSPPQQQPQQPEQQQPSNGYKVLPKSYWAGASWRWRSKSDQEGH